MTGKTCLIVEDQVETGEYLKKIVNMAFPDAVTMIVQDVKAALSAINNSLQFKDNPLGLAIVDLGLPDGSGIDVIRTLKEKNPDVPAVVATIYDDDNYLFQALAAGAYGYLLKADDHTDMVDALKKISKDAPPLSPAIARRLIKHFQAPQVEEVPQIKLSPREQETLTLIARGLTVGEVAGKLQLSPLTVAGYVKTIYQKMHVSNRVELVREATRRGLVK